MGTAQIGTCTRCKVILIMCFYTFFMLPPKGRAFTFTLFGRSVRKFRLSHSSALMLEKWGYLCHLDTFTDSALCFCILAVRMRENTSMGIVLLLYFCNMIFFKIYIIISITIFTLSHLLQIHFICVFYM